MKPFAHQAKEYADHWTTKSRALLWSMRTGKTRAIIDNACALYQACAIDAVIVVAPNGVHRNWTLKQLPEWHWSNVPYHAYAWRVADKDRLNAVERLAQAPGLVWLTINMESFTRDDMKTAVKRFIRSRPNFMIVFDESHHFAQPGSKRTKAARFLSKHASYNRILTGTTMEDSPLQTYSQFELLEPHALGYADYEKFQTHFVRYKQHYSGKFPVVDEYLNMPDLRLAMSRFASVVLRKDCEDLPPLQMDARIVELTDEQRMYFDAFKKKDVKILTALGFQQPPTGGALFVKLQQIEGGYVKTPTGIKVIPSVKFNVALEELLGYSAIVWCQFIHEIEALAKFLGPKAAPLHGNTPDREGTLNRFRRGAIDWIVAEPHCIAEGYNISTAEKMLWYSQTHTARIRSQANERATETGGGSKQIVDMYCPKGVNEYFLELTTTKTALADDVARRGLQRIIDGLGE